LDILCQTEGGTNEVTDFEILRRADYLIGSFQSNAYRLATEEKHQEDGNQCQWHAPSAEVCKRLQEKGGRF